MMKTSCLVLAVMATLAFVEINGNQQYHGTYPDYGSSASGNGWNVYFTIQDRELLNALKIRVHALEQTQQEIIRFLRENPGAGATRPDGIGSVHKITDAIGQIFGSSVQK